MKLTNTITEIKKIWRIQQQTTSSRRKDKSLEIIQSEEQKEKEMKNNEKSLKVLWDTIKQTRRLIMRIL
jgi:hypothetical protein